MIPRFQPIDHQLGAELSELVLHALAKVDLDHGCGHVTDTAGLCVRCPDRGLLCIPCGQRHITQDHDLQWRFTCDRCGAVDDGLHLPVGFERLRHRGRDVVVIYEGLGVCRRCVHQSTHQGGGVG